MVSQSSIHLDAYLRRFRAILHDPERYPDPEEFKPERFLNEDGTVRDDPTLALVFGVGKRICPGRHLVDATLFIVAASVLSTFNVTKAKDESGNEIPVNAALVISGGVVVYVLVCHLLMLLDAENRRVILKTTREVYVLYCTKR